MHGIVLPERKARISRKSERRRANKLVLPVDSDPINDEVFIIVQDEQSFVLGVIVVDGRQQWWGSPENVRDVDRLWIIAFNQNESSA